MSIYGIPPIVEGVTTQVALTKLMNQGVPMIADPTSAVRGQISSALSGTTLPVGDQPNGVTAGVLAELGSAMSSLGSAMTQYGAHTADQIANFHQRAAQAESAINLNETLREQNSELHAAGNPCDLLNSFFGSIMAAGMALLNNILSVVQAIQAAIAAGLAAVNAIIQKILGLAQQALAMIAAEVAALADWASKLLNMAFASILNLFNKVGSCVGGLVGSIATPAALGALTR